MSRPGKCLESGADGGDMASAGAENPKGWLTVGSNETRPAILLVDSDRAALDAVEEGLSDEFSVYQALSVDEACATLTNCPSITAVALTVSDRFDNHASMMRLREHVKDRPVVLVLGFPNGPTEYVPPSGFDPFGLTHKGERPDHLVLLLREAVRLQQLRESRRG